MSRGLLADRGLRRRARLLLRAGRADDRQSLGALWQRARPTSSSPATPTSCRRATRRTGVSTLLRRRRRRRRSGAAAPADMKGGVAAALAAALRFVARGDFAGSISFLLTGDEEGAGGQRHGQAARMGARARRALRSLPARRTDQRRRARRHDQERPPRLADRPADAASASRATSPIRISPTIRSARWRRSSPRCKAPALDAGHGRISIPRTSKSSASTSAIRRPTSFPAEVRLVFNIALQRSLDAADPARRDRAAHRRGGGRRALHADLRSDQCRRLPHRRAAPSPISSPRAIEDVTGRRPKLSTSGGTSDARFIKDACPVIETRPRRRDHARGRRARARSTTSKRCRASTSGRWSFISPRTSAAQRVRAGEAT